MTKELRSCPFCGGEPYIEELEGYPDTVICSNDSCHLGRNDIEFEVDDWNTRVSILGTLKVKLSILDSEPMTELVDIIVKHVDDMPESMRQQFVAWTEKHTTDED